jgi:hypothetical protein
MPDFDTQRLQGPNEPNRLRTLLIAKWLRTVLIVVGNYFFVMVVVPGGVLIYQYSGLDDKLGEVDDKLGGIGDKSLRG